LRTGRSGLSCVAGRKLSKVGDVSESSLADRLREVGGVSTLVLTHRGRKSGKSYEVTIWFVVDGEMIVLPSANVNTNWPRNLRANPATTIRIGSQTFQGTAAEITDLAERLRALKMAQRKYWYAAPFIWLTRVLVSSGAWSERNTSFRVKVSN
jgi:deazaflavin-dependent oxidoreductase (nitroreductase family)